MPPHMPPIYRRSLRSSGWLTRPEEQGAKAPIRPDPAYLAAARKRLALGISVRFDGLWHITRGAHLLASTTTAAMATKLYLQHCKQLEASLT